MNTKKTVNQLELQYQQIFFRAAINTITIAFFPFYSILLYKQTESISAIVIDRIFFYLGIWVGFVIFSFAIDSLGYLNAFRTSIGLQCLSLFLVFIFLSDLTKVYWFIALIIGIARGTYWPIHHEIYLREISTGIRSQLINLIEAMTKTQEVILPITIGALISYTNEYSYMVVICIAILVLAISYPWRYNKHPQAKITSREVNRLLRLRGIKRLGVIYVLNDITTVIYALTFAIIPYLILESEFKVGGLATVAALFAALSLIKERKFKISRKTSIAYFLSVVEGIFNMIFVIFWTPTALFLRNTTVSYTGALNSTAFGDLAVRTQEKILGEFRRESSKEMNLFLETIMMISRVSLLFVFYVIIEYFLEGRSFMDWVKIIIMLLAFNNLIPLILLKKLNDKTKIG